MKKMLTAGLILGMLLSGSVSAQYPWQNMGPGGGGELSCVTNHPTNPNIMYLGSVAGVVFRSNDGGQSWTNMNNNLAHLEYGASVFQVHDIVIDPMHSETIYLCTSSGLFRSLDEGQEWHLLYPSSLNEENRVSVATLAIDPAKPDTLYMGLGSRMDENQIQPFEFGDYTGVSGFLISRDHGLSWINVDVGMPAMTAVQSILINPLNTSQITVATTKGVYRSGVNSVTQVWRAGFPYTFAGGLTPAQEYTEINDLDEVPSSQPFVSGDSIIIRGSSKTGVVISSEFVYGPANDGTTLGDILAIINTSGENGWGEFSWAYLLDGEIVLEDIHAGDSETFIYMYAAPTNIGRISVPYFEEIVSGFTASELSVPQIWAAGFPYTLDSRIPAQETTEFNDLQETDPNNPLIAGDEIVINGTDNTGMHLDLLFRYGESSPGNDYNGTTLGDLLALINSATIGWGAFTTVTIVNGKIHLEDIIPGESETTINMYAQPGNAGQIAIPYFEEVSAGFTPGNYWSSKNDGLPHHSTLQITDIAIDGNYKLLATLKAVLTDADSWTVRGGVFMSENSGDTWIDISSNLPLYDTQDSIAWDYTSLALNPFNPDKIYVASNVGNDFTQPHIFMTQNGGLDWEMIQIESSTGWTNAEWLASTLIRDLEVGPGNSDRVSICGSEFLQSHDGAESWEQSYTQQINGAWQGTGLELMNSECIAFDNNNPDLLYVGYDDTGLFRSENGGTTFTRLDSVQNLQVGTLSKMDAVKDLWVDPENGDLYMSRWDGVLDGLQSNFSSGGLVFSSDRGNHQESISNGLPEGRCDLILDKQSGSPGNRVLYTAIYGQGVYKSINSGASWVSINEGLGSNASRGWEIAIDPNNPDVLFLGINAPCEDLDGLYKSTDGGSYWRQQLSFPVGDVLAICMDDESNVYASVTNSFEWSQTGGLFGSSDGGDNWDELLSHARIIDIDVHPQDQSTLLATGQVSNVWGGGDAPALYLSSDGGMDWQDISSGLNHAKLNYARFDPHQPQAIFAGTAGGGIWKLDHTFSNMNEPVESPQVFRLDQNFPNPFNPSTSIQFVLEQPGEVSLKIYDIRGAEIAQLASGHYESGFYSIQYSPENMASGTYIYTLNSESSRSVKRMVYLK